jgi:uncharacterized membrane protein
MLLVVLCLYIPINIVESFIPSGESGSSSQRLYFEASWLLRGLFGVIAIIAMAYIVEKAIQGGKIVWAEALKHGFSRWGSVIVTNILANIILLGLSLLLIVPGIIWYVYYTFYVYVVALRSIGGKTALDYSKNLVKGQWWRVAGISLLTVILYGLASVIIAIPFIFLPPHQIGGIISTTISSVIFSIGNVTMMIFFLNTDYLKNPAPFAPLDFVEGVAPATQP